MELFDRAEEVVGFADEHYEYHIRFALSRSVERINEDVERMNKLNI